MFVIKTLCSPCILYVSSIFICLSFCGFMFVLVLLLVTGLLTPRINKQILNCSELLWGQDCLIWRATTTGFQFPLGPQHFTLHRRFHTVSGVHQPAHARGIGFSPPPPDTSTGPYALLAYFLTKHRGNLNNTYGKFFISPSLLAYVNANITHTHTHTIQRHTNDGHKQ
jgi:hypothetical protein